MNLIKQKDKRCLAEWVLGSGNANRCAFVSFFSLWTTSRILFGYFLKSISHKMLISQTSIVPALCSCSWNLLLLFFFWSVGRWFAPCCWWPQWHILCAATLGSQLKWTMPTWCIWLIIWDFQPQKRKTEGHYRAVSALIDTSFLVEAHICSLFGWSILQFQQIIFNWQTFLLPSKYISQLAITAHINLNTQWPSHR